MCWEPKIAVVNKEKDAAVATSEDEVEKHKVVELEEELNAKSPQEDVETYQESHSDVVTISESPHDAMEDDEDEEDVNAELEKPINM